MSSFVQVELFSDIILIIYMTLMAIYNFKTKIYRNKVVIPAFLIALVFRLCESKFYPQKVRPLDIIIGFAILMVPFVILYIKKTIGAGDMKYMAAIGLMIGWGRALLCSLFCLLLFCIVWFFYLKLEKSEEDQRLLPSGVLWLICTILSLITARLFFNI